MQAKNYITPGLLTLFVAVTLGWFIWAPSSNDASAVATESLSAQAYRGEGARAGRTGRPASFGRSPFLATHEQGTAFTPTGDNLAPRFHIEMEALKQALEQAPQDTTLLIRMARLKQDGHQTEEAVAYYRRYLALRPQGRQAWLDLAQCYGTLEQWTEAQKATQDLLRRFPDDPAGLYNLGAVYANTGRLGEARTTWERVAGQGRSPEMKTLAEGALQRLAALHP